MKTGEGKTLVSTLPVYLNALTGEGVHLVTVNDYLARRDAEWMGQVHRFLGLNVGRVVARDRGLGRPRRTPTPATSPTGPTPSSASTTSATTWPDRWSTWCSAATPTPSSTRSTPSSSTRPGPRSSSRGPRRSRPGSTTSSPAWPGRSPATRTTRSTRRRGRSLRPRQGIDKVERAARHRQPLRPGVGQLRPPADAGPKAKELYKRDKDYIVADGEVKIVDEFTGRILEGRRWSDGLHQAVEAKERVTHQGGEPHLGDRDPPELLPAVREARRNDRHGRDRGLGVRQHLRPAGGPDPDQQADGPRRRAGPDLQDPSRPSSRPSSRTSSSATTRASRSWSAPHRWRSPRSSPGCSNGGASRTTSSTPSSTPGRPRSWPRRAAPCRHGGDQHGRPRRRHPARRQP